MFGKKRKKYVDFKNTGSVDGSDSQYSRQNSSYTSPELLREDAQLLKYETRLNSKSSEHIKLPTPNGQYHGKAFIIVLTIINFLVIKDIIRIICTVFLSSVGIRAGFIPFLISLLLIPSFLRLAHEIWRRLPPHFRIMGRQIIARFYGELEKS